MNRLIVLLLVVTASLGAFDSVFASEPSDCPIEGTLEGRMRIADGEPSCEEIAKRSTPARPISLTERKRIMAAFDRLLVDGPSARWRWGKVVRGNVACLWINSKNRMGGYSGWSEYTFNLDDGTVSSREELEALLMRLGMAGSEGNICGTMPSA